MGGASNRSRELLGLEHKTPLSSSLESRLVVCNKDLKPKTCNEKLVTAPVPKSQVLGKVKDFLGIMAEANKRLQHESKDGSSKEYDIETLTGNEDEYIEMDLVLGVADLHTPEAVAAAESAISGFQPTIPLVPAGNGSDSESDTDSDEDEDHDDDDEDIDSDNDDHDKVCSPNKIQEPTLDKGNHSSNSQTKKRQKLIELL